jgi:serine/threonine-protein kinase
MLKDPDFNIHSKAIDALSRINDPNLIMYLVEMLQDNSEDIRRAAVEVLNNVGSDAAIKDLFNSLRDKDWWVRSRAADALANIGGDNVINAVLRLIKSDDEFLRRSAVEIINKLKDDRAVKHLIVALDDTDWWVRERAADALADMNEQRALPKMLQILTKYPDSSPGMIQAIAKLGEQQTVQPLLDCLKNPEFKNKKTIVRVLEEMVDDKNIDEIQAALTIVANTGDKETQSLANQTMQTLITRRGGNQEPTSIDGSTRGPSTLGGSTPSTAGPTQVDNENQFIDADSLEPDSILAKRYKVIRQVGKGAFGVVILVEDLMVNEQIILKFLNPHMASDESVIQRFVHEMRYTRKITHPNVIRIYDFLTFGKSYAISMEYFDSHSLGQEIKQKKNLDFKRNLKLLVDICKGLTVAHNLKIVHRDIKPANILINDDDLVKIVDFGLASAVTASDSRLTKSGILVGTPTYMAPEQVRGRDIDLRTDIYSLGIVMYELFTGKPPYKDKDHMATLFQHVEGKAKQANEINPVISNELNQVIMRAINVDPEQRYQRIEQLQHDIEKLLKEATV